MSQWLGMVVTCVRVWGLWVMWAMGTVVGRTGSTAAGDDVGNGDVLCVVKGHGVFICSETADFQFWFCQIWTLTGSGSLDSAAQVNRQELEMSTSYTCEYEYSSEASKEALVLNSSSTCTRSEP
ncbi:hypothetical protein EDB89DRAFT_1907318 [Lactarius sanguifluus]|nr:hypothetical protein EDB89DRAFT_1907318 [Lactarius sanguifluus]